MDVQMIKMTLVVLGFLCAMVGGVFLSFSDFIMRGFAHADSTGAIACMQGLNQTVYRSIFLFSFLGLVPATIGVAIHAGEAKVYLAATIFLCRFFW